MRWDNLRLLDEPEETSEQKLFSPYTVVRTFNTPEFRGITFYEIQSRSIINRVPDSSHVPFRWTINPYRGCSHACIYCFARKTHTYLDFDTGHDFDSKIIVKVNAPTLVRQELAAARWSGEHIAMGTNVDCYQRAEGRYGLMRGILEALRDFRNPFSILTKGTLILRDLDLLVEAAKVTEVMTNVSVGSMDPTMWRTVEPGTPSPRARLNVCRTLNEAGISCGVLMAPILPFLTDSTDQLEETVRAISEANAISVTPIILHLRSGAREWYFAWLSEKHPTLVAKYQHLYGRSAYADKTYQRRITDQVHELAKHYGMDKRSPAATRETRQAVKSESASAEQLSLNLE